MIAERHILTNALRVAVDLYDCDGRTAGEESKNLEYRIQQQALEARCFADEIEQADRISLRMEMSKSGCREDCDDQWALIRWRGAVNAAIKGKRGQAFLKEMLAALDALPEPKLIAWDLEKDGAVCAIGAVGKARGINMAPLESEGRETVAATFRIASALCQEIVYMNDEVSSCETPEARFRRMRQWIEGLIC